MMNVSGKIYSYLAGSAALRSFRGFNFHAYTRPFFFVCIIDVVEVSFPFRFCVVMIFRTPYVLPHSEYTVWTTL